MTLEAIAVGISAATLTVALTGAVWGGLSRVAVRLAVLETKVDGLGADVLELRGAVGLPPRPRNSSRGIEEITL